LNSPMREIYFQNDLYTYGGGVSLQFGVIATPNKNVRLGASYKSPTWYSLKDEFSQYLETQSNDAEGNSFNDVIDLTNTVNVYEDYTIKTPSELRGSLAYIFGTRGLVSFDYIVKNYQNTHIGPNDNDVFIALNDQIDQSWTSVSSYRIGGEFRQGGVSLRAGYHHEESPYSNTSIIGDRSGYSFGIGLNFRSSVINLSLLNSEQRRSHQLYDTGLSDSAENDINLKHFTLSWNFNF
jgi:long-subunit fatty acid transport protein